MAMLVLYRDYTDRKEIKKKKIGKRCGYDETMPEPYSTKKNTTNSAGIYSINFLG